MTKAREAFVFWNAGICTVIDAETRKSITSSKHFRRATRKARRFGYDVRVYKGEHATAPADARDVSAGSYILPAVPG